MSKYDQFDDEQEHADTEITLGLRSILGIFFGLVLICGVFFGFGYSLGRSGVVKPSAAQQASAQPSSNATAPVATTVAEQPASSSASDPYDFNANSSVQTKATGAIPQTSASTTATGQTLVTAPASFSAAQTTATGSPQTKPASYAIPNPARQTPVSSAALTAAERASIMVQVAAIARPQDADVLISALQQRGFNATVRREASDSLLHVQIGPFATRQQALAMRTRLLNDGYNAILK